MSGPDPVARVAHRAVGPDETRRANTRWWDGASDDYQRQHAVELGEVSFVWSPEGAREDELGLLGQVSGRRVLEVGCGAAQCARWLAARGADVVGFDLSAGQLRHARRMNAETGMDVRLVQADATALPFAAESFDLACSAYGAVPFVADSGAVMREVARVLHPGGRWVFSDLHPFRWCFPDDPTSLTLATSYWDRTPYVEETESGEVTYVEHHRTMGDRIREFAAAGLRVVDLVEPQWPEGHVSTFTQFGGRKGQLVPGTAIWVTEKG